jgi:hypothetical protein
MQLNRKTELCCKIVSFKKQTNKNHFPQNELKDEKETTCKLLQQKHIKKISLQNFFIKKYKVLKYLCRKNNAEKIPSQMINNM